MSPDVRVLTHDEKLRWGTCPDCNAPHGVPCRPPADADAALRGNFGAHMRRFSAAPFRVADTHLAPPTVTAGDPVNDLSGHAESCTSESCAPHCHMPMPREARAGALLAPNSKLQHVVLRIDGGFAIADSRGVLCEIRTTQFAPSAAAIVGDALRSRSSFRDDAEAEIEAAAVALAIADAFDRAGGVRGGPPTAETREHVAALSAG